MAKSKTNSNILSLHGGLDLYDEDKCVDINIRSSSLLGRMLSPKYKFTFTTPIGKFNSVQTFMYYITVPNYPTKYLEKQLPTYKELKEILSKSPVVTLPNFYSLVALAVLSRISQDDKLQKLIKGNKLPYTATTEKEVRLFDSKPFLTKMVDNKMSRYVAIIRLVEQDLKSGAVLSKEYIEKFVNDCKDRPKADLLEGAAFLIGAKPVEKNVEEDNKEVVQPTAEDTQATGAEVDTTAESK